LEALARALLEAETLDEEAAYAAAGVPHTAVGSETPTAVAFVGGSAPLTKDET
jgi:hypothetical protein